MPSIRHELESTRTTRWYLETRSAQRGGPWRERVQCYAALSAILAEDVCQDAAGQPHALLKRVAQRANFASAEPVYRRWRHKQDGQPVVRWAGADPSVKPGAALVSEAKIAAFWPYREGVIEAADAFDMTTAEWAAAYLRALAAWAADNRPLAACRPTGPPGCTTEDLEVLTSSPAVAGAPPDEARAARLQELAGIVVGQVLDDVSITPTGAFDAVRGEVQHLLAGPRPLLADRAVRSVAELTDRLLHHDDVENVMTAGQASQVIDLLDGLTSLLAGFATTPGPGQDR